MMSTTATSPETAPVKKLWRQWTSIVELFAENRMARHQVKPEDYSTLHARVLQACRSISGTKQEAPPMVKRGAEIATPWLSLESLKSADHEILQNLYQSCQAVQRELDSWGTRLGGVNRRSVALFALLFGVVFLFGLALSNPAGTFEGLRKGWEYFVALRESVWLQVASNPKTVRLWSVGSMAAVLTVIMAYVTFRSPKEY